MSLTSYEIKNRKVLDLLEDFRYTYRELYQPEKTNQILVESQVGMADHYTGEDEMLRIIRMGEDHHGAAENSVCHPIKKEFYRGTHPEEYAKTWSYLDSEMKTELGLETSALSTLYPPNGFIGWHNNANASAFNLIFTWSENGDGWFKYVDPNTLSTTREVITVPDKKGWQLKAGHFGAYGSGDVVYHAARTNCYRMTLSYVLGHNEDYWQDCVDYITSE
jgi:hypothetical protein